MEKLALIDNLNRAITFLRNAQLNDYVSPKLYGELDDVMARIADMVEQAEK